MREAVPTLCFSFSEFQLILTIVGSIGGALILCLVIALITLARYGVDASLSLEHSTASIRLGVLNLPSLAWGKRRGR